MLAKAQTLFHTLRYFSFRQLFYLFKRRLLPPPALQHLPTGDITSLNPAISLDAIVYNATAKLHGDRFVFLHEPGKQFSTDTYDIDWRASEYPKLWRYNLHYFDWVKDENIDPEAQRRILESWIVNNPVGNEDAWEPYTVSLRLVNWLKLFYRLQKADYKISQVWLVSFQTQAQWLEKHMEFHIRANHLLKNWVALMYAGLATQGLFDHKRLFNIIEEFEKEVNEQFLVDGGHYERSPMYHCICLEDLIDVYHLLSQYLATALVSPVVVAPVLERKLGVLQKSLAVKIAAAIDYLGVVTFRDGNICLFADSALGIAPSPERLIDYWNQVYGGEAQANLNDKYFEGDILLPQSGYYKSTTPVYQLITNVGDPSPAYQPGHTHCDLLSYELLWGNQRLVVDTGVHEYAPGKRRSHCRSTQAHNTVQVDNAQQHQVWGEFRVGKRASVFNVEQYHQDKCRIVAASHDGFSRLYPGLVHLRRFNLEADQVLVEDHVFYQKKSARVDESAKLVQSRLHLGPDFMAQQDSGNGPLVIKEKASQKVIAHLNTDVPFQLVKAEYYPEFGKIEEIDCICFELRATPPISISYRIVFL